MVHALNFVHLATSNLNTEPGMLALPSSYQSVCSHILLSDSHFVTFLRIRLTLLQGREFSHESCIEFTHFLIQFQLTFLTHPYKLESGRVSNHPLPLSRLLPRT